MCGPSVDIVEWYGWAVAIEPSKLLNDSFTVAIGSLCTCC